MKPATVATPALRIPLHRSRRLLLAQWLAHGIAAFAVLRADIPGGLGWLLLALVAVSLLHQHRLTPVTALILHGDGRLEKISSDGAASAMALHRHTTVLPFMTVLLYRQNGRLAALPLLADSLAAEDWRQLRLYLRWRAAHTLAAN
ncbi:MAG: protein YgfX [Rugosibacter sp.]|jgi:hypothetical protein